MKLTVEINLADQLAVLQEKHSLTAGDTYNPLVLDFSRLTEAELAAVDTGSLSLVLYRSESDRIEIASTNQFAVPTGKVKYRTAVLLLNQQPMKDWFASAGGGRKTCYLELCDGETTYAACEVPIILRDFAVGSSDTGYYTVPQIDRLLEAKQALVETFVGLSFSSGELSLLPATVSAIGGVKPGSGLAVATDGTLSVSFPPIDSSFDIGSANAVQNAVVAAAVDGIVDRLTALDDASTGRVGVVEASLAAKVDDGALAPVAKSGSYNDLSDKPVIPDEAFSAKWHAGTRITGTSADESVFPLSGLVSSISGDMYLNTATGDTYVCTVSGDADTAKWLFVSNIKGPKGDAGNDGSTTISRSYSSVVQMQAAWASDDVPENAIVVISSSDADNGKIYRKGPANYVYLASLRGPKGDTGDTSRWYVGTGVTGTPSDAVPFPESGVSSAVAGSMYLNSSTGDTYRCELGGEPSVARWVYVCSTKGVPGSDGAAGTTIMTGTVVTSSSTFAVAAKVGDLYFNSSTSDLYHCTVAGASTSEWMLVRNLSGASGADGRTWFSGTDVTAAGIYTIDGAKAGDLYLCSSDGKAYRCTGVSGATSMWALVVDLKGADGRDGNTILCGTQVVSAADYTIAGAKAGDYYLNSSNRDFYRCTATNGDYSTWVFLFNLSGMAGPSSTTDGYVPVWSSTTGTTLGTGYYVATSMPASAAAGSGQLITAGAVFTALSGITDGFVSASGAHESGAVPAWGTDASLSAGYTVRTLVRTTGATDNCLVTERAVRAALGSGNNVQMPASHTEDYIPQWGPGSELKLGLRLVTEVRTADNALATAVPTELAVRSALTALSESFANKKLDELGAPVSGSTSLDATTTTHGLMPSADKAKLDAMVDVQSLSDVAADLEDADEIQVKDASVSTPVKFRSSQLSRVWSFIQTHLRGFPIDQLAVGDEDSTNGDASTSCHGLLPKLPGGETQFLRADGSFAAPPGSSLFVGDSGEGGTAGQVPAPKAGDGTSDKFLKADGTWAVPPIQTGSEHITIDGQATVEALESPDEFILYDKSESNFRKVSAQNLSKFAQAYVHYDTVFVPAGAMAPLETDGAVAGQFSFAANLTTHDILRFLNTKNTSAGFDLVFPDDWDLREIKMRVLWIPYNSDGAAGQWVRFSVAARAYGDGEDLSLSLGGSTTIDDQQIAVNQLHRTDASDAFMVDGVLAQGKVVHFRISREYNFSNGGDGAALGTGACVLGVEIQYRRTADFTGW